MGLSKAIKNLTGVELPTPVRYKNNKEYKKNVRRWPRYVAPIRHFESADGSTVVELNRNLQVNKIIKIGKELVGSEEVATASVETGEFKGRAVRVLGASLVTPNTVLSTNEKGEVISVFAGTYTILIGTIKEDK